MRYQTLEKNYFAYIFYWSLSDMRSFNFIAYSSTLELAGEKKNAKTKQTNDRGTDNLFNTIFTKKRFIV